MQEALVEILPLLDAKHGSVQTMQEHNHKGM
jgi:hypothetical protein